MDPRTPQGMAKTSKHSGSISPLLLFARNFIKHPRMLGSVIPSSRFLIRQVLDQVNWQRANLIVEFGPGVGTFTREILARLKPEGRLLALDTNPDFVRYLRDTIADPRLIVLEESAAELPRILERLRLAQPDYVISGIPFSTMSAPLRASILEGCRDVLGPQGRMLVYQFSAAVGSDLRRVFGEVEQGFEPRNLLPARWFACTKRGPMAVVAQREVG